MSDGLILDGDTDMSDSDYDWLDALAGGADDEPIAAVVPYIPPVADAVVPRAPTLRRCSSEELLDAIAFLRSPPIPLNPNNTNEGIHSSATFGSARASESTDVK